MEGTAFGIDAAALALIRILELGGIQVDNAPASITNGRGELFNSPRFCLVARDFFDLEQLDQIAREMVKKHQQPHLGWTDLVATMVDKLGHVPYRAGHKPTSAIPTPPGGVADAYSHL